MLQPLLRPYLASLLLLCLLRTLLPEAWVLALHAHAHTTTELAPTRPTKAQKLLTTKHTHCHTEQFYDVPFRLAPGVAVPQPRRQTRYQRLVVPAPLACSAAALRRTSLRGPPQA